MSKPAVQKRDRGGEPEDARVERAADGDPGRRRRDPQRESQHQVRERGEALGERVEEDDRQRHRRQPQAQRIQRRAAAGRTRRGAPPRSPRRSRATAPGGQMAHLRARIARVDVRVQQAVERHGGRARRPPSPPRSRPASTPARRVAKPPSRKASSAPVSAKGRAKTECSNLIMSSVRRMRVPETAALRAAITAIIPCDAFRAHRLLCCVPARCAAAPTAAAWRTSTRATSRLPNGKRDPRRSHDEPRRHGARHDVPRLARGRPRHALHPRSAGQLPLLDVPVKIPLDIIWIDSRASYR